MRRSLYFMCKWKAVSSLVYKAVVMAAVSERNDDCPRRALVVRLLCVMDLRHRLFRTEIVMAVQLSEAVWRYCEGWTWSL